MGSKIATVAVAVALGAALAACGSSGGSDAVASAEGQAGPAKIQRELAREYGLDEPRCERDPRGSGRGRFACYFEDKSSRR